MGSWTRSFALFLLLAAGQGSAAPLPAHFEYPGCDTIKPSDFRVDTLVRGPAADPLTKEPLKMAFDRDDQGNVDVYFVQRYGMVRRYSGATGTTSTLADFAFTSGNNAADTNQICNNCVSSGTSLFSSSEGLMAIALDPGFRNNRWVYLYFTMKGVWRVTRYKLTGSTLDLGSAKTILRFTHPSFSQHMGGVLRFDGDGNLWVTVADNGSTDKTTFPLAADQRFQAANTNSFFGKILRIRPRPLPDDLPAPAPGVDSTYDIPDDNLFPRGTPKTLPEIYVMGTRNPYSLTIDSVRKSVAWGDVGPDNFAASSENPAQASEEFNFTGKPGNFGWPYWVGNYNGGINVTTSPLPPGSTPAAPINNRPDNTGLISLPPAIPATLAYGRNCAIAGPIYYYDSNLVSPVKFPPHFHGAWFVGDFNRDWIHVLTLDRPGDRVLSEKKLFFAKGNDGEGYLKSLNGMPANNGILELQMGPDGALYVLNYAGYRTTSAATGILRIAYRGSCRIPRLPAPQDMTPPADTLKPPSSVSTDTLTPPADTLKPPDDTVAPPDTTLLPKPSTDSLTALRHGRAGTSIWMRGNVVGISLPGPHRLELWDTRGRVLWSRTGKGPAVYDVGEPARGGLRILMVAAGDARLVRKLFR